MGDGARKMRRYYSKVEKKEEDKAKNTVRHS